MDNRSSSDFPPPPTIFPLSPVGQNPTKKRTKIAAKPSRKPDPDAPKVTPPCTECGKRFWSWKALFGHMRCHPEREWRGINRPPSLHRRNDSEESSAATEEDHEVASCLLLLANGDEYDDLESPSTACTVNDYYYNNYYCHSDNNNNNNNNDRGFECSSCKKVFGSHQALGGHRASHKNVKGCYAIAMNNVDYQEHSVEGDVIHGNQTITRHKCSICMRVFSSGQALGGHKRCHWEKAGGFDLNCPALNGEDQECVSSYSSIDSADLRHPDLDLSLRL